MYLEQKNWIVTLIESVQEEYDNRKIIIHLLKVRIKTIITKYYILIEESYFTFENLFKGYKKDFKQGVNIKFRTF